MAKGNERQRENALRISEALDVLRYSPEGLNVIAMLAQTLEYNEIQLVEDIEDLYKYVRKKKN